MNEINELYIVMGIIIVWVCIEIYDFRIRKTLKKNK